MNEARADTYSDGKHGLARIRLLNASPDIPAADIFVNGEPVSKNHLYRAFTEYAGAKPGIYNIMATLPGRRTKPLASEDAELLPGLIYTLALTGAAGEYGFRLIGDFPARPGSGRCYMRFINLSPQSPEYDIFIDGAMTAERLCYLEETGYYELTPGQYPLEIRDADTGRVLMSHPGMKLGGGRMFACHIVGIAGASPGIEVLLPLEGSTYLR